MQLYEQGDVLLFLEAIPPTNNFKKELVNDTVQHGESGHSHRLAGEYEYFETPQKTRHLRIVTPCDLYHEEHKTIVLPPGEYRIGIVQEYDHFEEEARQVID
jgi:hypothetical protein